VFVVEHARCASTLTTFFLKIGITIELSKIELKHFTAYDVTASQHKFLHKKQPSLFFNNYEIKPLDIWRYLGFFFDSFLNFNFHTKYYTNKAFSALRACNMLGNSCKGLNPKNRILAYRSCIIPVLSYGAPLWYSFHGIGTKKNLMLMNCVQNFAVRWITGGFQTMPIGAMELLLGILPLYISMNLLLSGTIARIHVLPHNHLLKNLFDVECLHVHMKGKKLKKWPSHLPSDDPIDRL